VIGPAVFEVDHPNVTALPEQVQDAVRRAFRSAPEAGQLWRVAWADLAPRLAVVIDVGDAFTIVAPVTLDTSRRVDAALVLSSTPLGVEAVVWPQLRTGLGDFTLAECFGALTAADAQAVADRAAARPTVADLDRWNAGLDAEQVVSRRGYRDGLAREFAVLCDSDWNHADLFDDPDEYVDADAAREIGLTAKELARVTGVPADVAYPVWKGEHPLPADAREALVDAFGDGVVAVLRSMPTDADARRALDSPEVREQIAAAADHERTTEADLRRDLYRDLVAAPGRESGPRDQRDYRQRLQMLLHARLG